MNSETEGRPAETVRILIADDHEAIRDGLRRLIERQSGWNVCGVASTGPEAIQETRSLKPDVVILDMSMPGLNGIEATRQIRRFSEETEVLIFTGHSMDELIPDVFEAGAKSFILKSESSSNLLDAIRSLSQHKPYFTKAVSDRLFSKLVNRRIDEPRAKQTFRGLTVREREIVKLLAEGKSNKDVASALDLSLRTVETHRARILRKLGIDSLAGLVRYAVRQKIIQA
jgi:DNA-binding NarL/FixJ family response regulator